MRRLFLALCFFCSACVGSEFDNVQITSASLDIDMSTIMAVIGGAGGDGVLTFTKDDGTTGSCTVSMRGPMLGAAFMVSSGPNTIDLILPAASVALSDVFGVYTGGSAGGALIVGGEARSATNNSGVSFDDTDGVFGVGFYVAIEFLRIIPPAVEDCIL